MTLWSLTSNASRRQAQTSEDLDPDGDDGWLPGCLEAFSPD